MKIFKIEKVMPFLCPNNSYHSQSLQIENNAIGNNFEQIACPMSLSVSVYRLVAGIPIDRFLSA
jgi:hypothetical protein